MAAAAVPAMAGPAAADDVDVFAHALRDEAAAVLANLPAVEVAILLAGGGETTVHDAPRAIADPHGAPRREEPVRTDESLLRAILRRGQAPRTQSAALTGALGHLALLLRDVAPDTAVVPVTVAARAAPVALDATAIGLAGAAAASGRDVVVLACGDLASAGADGVDAARGAAVGGDEAARRWDDQAAAAVAAGDLATLRSLGPDAAHRVGARGWAPLTVLLGIAQHDGLRVTRSTYHLIGHVGRFTALMEPGR